jgi:hypothetical protein
MSHSCHDQSEGGLAAQTLPSQPKRDDALALDLAEQVHHPHLIVPVVSVSATAAECACMNLHERSSARDTCKESRRFKIGCTGSGWPRSDVPHIRLRGRWLERAGFVIGLSVRVGVDDRRLIIEPVD